MSNSIWIVRMPEKKTAAILKLLWIGTRPRTNLVRLWWIWFRRNGKTKQRYQGWNFRRTFTGKTMNLSIGLVKNREEPRLPKMYFILIIFVLAWCKSNWSLRNFFRMWPYSRDSNDVWILQSESRILLYLLHGRVECIQERDYVQYFYTISLAYGLKASG